MALPPSEKVMVSVLLTTYNQAGSIGRALDGVLTQRTPGFDVEILLGDDASSDATPDICRWYAERFPSKIRLFCRPKNLGVQANYFDLMRHARGKYLADCAGDDQWTDSYKLAIQVGLMEENPDMALCHTAWVERDAASGKISPSTKPFHGLPVEPKDALVLPILQHRSDRFIHLCTALWRRDWMMEELDADPDIFLDPQWGLEDLQVETAMASRGTVGFIPRVTLAYTVGAPSISSSEDQGKEFRFIYNATRLTRRLEQKYCVPHNELCAMYATRCRHLAKLAFNLNDRHRMALAVDLARSLNVSLGLDVNCRRWLMAVRLDSPLRSLLKLRRNTTQ